jgi:hypothetical protein
MLACGVAVLSASFALPAAAQAWNKRTSVTFSGPFEIPGRSAQILPAGTYVFKLLDSLSDRHIVQIYNADETEHIATILAIPNYRLKATDKTVITFAERLAGEPQALKAWFYPGDNSGQEFVYPKTRAVELAAIVDEPVLFMPDELAANIVAPAETAAAPPVVALRTAPIRAVAPTGVEIPVTEVVETPPVVVASLPKTASALPLLALAGFLLVGLGLSIPSLCDRWS